MRNLCANTATTNCCMALGSRMGTTYAHPREPPARPGREGSGLQTDITRPKNSRRTTSVDSAISNRSPPRSTANVERPLVDTTPTLTCRRIDRSLSRALAGLCHDGPRQSRHAVRWPRSPSCSPANASTSEVMQLHLRVVEELCAVSALADARHVFQSRSVNLEVMGHLGEFYRQR